MTYLTVMSRFTSGKCISAKSMKAQGVFRIRGKSSCFAHEIFPSVYLFHLLFNSCQKQTNLWNRYASLHLPEKCEWRTDDHRRRSQNVAQVVEWVRSNVDWLSLLMNSSLFKKTHPLMIKARKHSRKMQFDTDLWRKTVELVVHLKRKENRFESQIHATSTRILGPLFFNHWFD
jgi:hypothetical protein